MEGYIADLEKQRGKPLILLLIDSKYSESYLLNYTAVVLEGSVEISAKPIGINAEVNFTCGNFSIKRLFDPNTTILNKTGDMQVGLENDLNDSFEGYAVYMRLLYQYEARPLSPICIANARIHEQLLIFDTEGNLVYAFTIFLFLVAK